ncbi:hypothetical protein E2C01_101831 [Portunus trituberculatus]|uniref:Uncharacterized protein n=1 Tax=Portunus trituberculatus TaxID=210409 RepID=A0A5B7KAT7_PORTR|nr:hypothetical protein [Portunus trituberculatus]
MDESLKGTTSRKGRCHSLHLRNIDHRRRKGICRLALIAPIDDSDNTARLRHCLAPYTHISTYRPWILHAHAHTVLRNTGKTVNWA